ncbi:hypothetical protein ACLB2K_038136 [Fragaria x ananassa]
MEEDARVAMEALNGFPVAGNPLRIEFTKAVSYFLLDAFYFLRSQENLEPGFQFEKLSEATEGYSGSDLKNLCIAAAYRPVQELLEEETKGSKGDSSAALRPLRKKECDLKLPKEQ